MTELEGMQRDADTLATNGNAMNPRETALIGLGATIFSLVCCQLLVRAAGHHALVSSAQLGTGLAICLAGVVVGMLFVLSNAMLHDAPSGASRSLGALGLALGCVMLCALVVHGTREKFAAQATAEPASAHWVGLGRGTVLFAPGTSR